MTKSQKVYNKTEKHLQACKRYRDSIKGKLNSKKHTRHKKGRGYDISIDQYRELVSKQEGKCLICNRIDEDLCIDHDHLTSKIRGLLCRKCNTLLGMAGENKEILSNAIKYLEDNK
jgi:hypothetical protein